MQLCVQKQMIRWGLACSPTGPGRPGNPLGPSSPFWPNMPCCPLGPDSPSLPYERGHGSQNGISCAFSKRESSNTCILFPTIFKVVVSIQANVAEGRSMDTLNELRNTRNLLNVFVLKVISLQCHSSI